MRRYLLIFFIPLLLTSGCFLRHLTPLGRYGAAIEDWVGRPIGEVTAAWGAPTKRAAGSYTWATSDEVYSPPHTYTTTRRVDHYDNKGRRIGYSEVPYEEHVEGYYYTEWCKTKLYVDDKDIITKYEADGNDCERFTNIRRAPSAIK